MSTIRFALRQFRSFREGETLTIRTCGQFYFLPHYMVNWRELPRTKATQTCTPLLNFEMATLQHGRDTHLVPQPQQPQLAKLRALVLTCDYYKIAPSKVIIHTHREAILTELNQLSFPPVFNTIIIQLSPLCSFVPSSQLIFHLKQAATISIAAKITTNMKIIQLRQALNPFNLGKWAAFFKPAMIIHNRDWAKREQDIAIKYSLSHYYMLKFSRQPHLLLQDILSLTAMLAKFDFVAFLSKPELTNNAKHRQSRIQRFIRILKWRTPEAEQYLLYLLRTSSHPTQLRTALSSFPSLYKQLSASAAKCK